MNIYNQVHDLESVLQESNRILQRQQNQVNQLRLALSALIDDLEERATWNLNGTQQVVACGASVYKQAKKVLEDVWPPPK